MKIKNQTTGRVITLSRSASDIHPAWVHQQMESESELELQQTLEDYYNFKEMAENIGKPDICGVFLDQEGYDAIIADMSDDDLAGHLLPAISDMDYDAETSVTWLDIADQEWDFPCYLKIIDGGRRVMMWSDTDEASIQDVTVEEIEEDIQQQVQDFAEDTAPGTIVTEEMPYTVDISYRDSGNWMPTGDDREDFYDFSEACDYAKNAENGDYDDGEYRARVRSAAGDIEYTHEWRVDSNQDELESAIWLIEDEGEYTTEYYGISEDRETFLYSDQNGGKQGAHSSQEGDGRWSDMADGIEEINLEDIIRAFIDRGYSLAEAAQKIAEHHLTYSVDDIIKITKG